MFVGQVALQGRAHALPQVAHIGAQRGIGLQVAADLVGLACPGRVVLQARDEQLHRTVKLGTQLVLGVGRHLGQHGLQGMRQQCRTLLAQPVGGQHLFLARVLGFEPLHDGAGNQRARVFLLQQRNQALQRVAQQRLVAPVLRQRAQHARHGLRQVDLANQRARRPADEMLHLPVLHHVERRRQHARHLLAQQLRVARRQQPFGQPRHQVVPAHQCGQ